ncbi:hypothetical protein [Streptomyces sp. NBC_00887]|uniref:hypothetical protein n=1 Tax=Streptomyces sp. NBC_00887 TaxID=2975859 RepID=UPI00386303EB|nr:hypothetical protein OG844_01155 [Streptomyces sp. NBC_00887]WSY36222.1 hypothetical protein OG844_44440 [Streptomyces sp. NBC_00887]
MNSHRSSAGSAGSAGSDAPATAERSRVPTKAWLQPALIGLAILAGFIGAYIGLQRNPQPHELPIAVTGEQLAHEVGDALGTSAHIVHTATPAAARQALESRDVVASLTQNPGAGALHLEVAGANGQSTTGIVTGLVRTYAQETDQRLTVDDVIPLVKYDARGLAGFYLSFGVTLAGFVLAQSVLGLRAVLPQRYRFVLITAFSAAAGILAAVLAGPALGAVPAPVIPLAITLALLAAAAAFTTQLFGIYMGPIGVPVATLLLLTLGNATSGAVIGANLLPGPAHFISPLLPPGAAVRAIGNLSYFQNTSMLMPMITLAIWAVGAALLVAARPKLSRTKATGRP